MGSNAFNFRGLRLDISYGTGFVAETGFYCAYTCLFIAALPVMANARRLKDPHSSRPAWVFLIFSILMYLVATIHLVFIGLRFYKGIFLQIDPNGPISYIMNPSNWEFLGVTALLSIQTWLGDALVIYRCYCVWDHNPLLVFIPTCLLLASIGINSYVMYWIGHPYVAAPTIHLAGSIYPLAFVQNFANCIAPFALVQNLMTTSLIVLKIILQHCRSKKAGVTDAGSRLSLIHIVRIVIESAGIYTIQILVMNILYFRVDAFQFVVQSAIVPSIGITFLLLTIRIEASRHTTTRSDLSIRSSMLPRWLRKPDRGTDSRDREDSRYLSTGDGTNSVTPSVVEGDSGMDLDPQIFSTSITESKMAATSNLSLKNEAAYASESCKLQPGLLRSGCV